MAFGIDVSKWQGSINWQEVKKNNPKVEFAMLRTGWGKSNSNQIDKTFEKNYEGAKKAGINCGVYHYSYADSVKDATNEARFCLEIIEGRKLEYPVVFDYEDKQIKYVDRNTQNEICKAFCEEIEKNNGYAMIYVNLDWFKNEISGSELYNKYDFWIAQWNGKEKADVDCGIHQFADRALIQGINTYVDGSYSFRDYPQIMKDKHLNGY